MTEMIQLGELSISDLLEGRGTSSHGLDLAAEYIVAQFRRAGLEPAGDDAYFQTTTLTARGSDKPEKVRNVIGVLRGSDPALKDTYILVTAHYDHLGIRQTPEDTVIYNGANDDGSGTVSVMELASALSADRTKGMGRSRCSAERAISTSPTTRRGTVARPTPPTAFAT